MKILHFAILLLSVAISRRTAVPLPPSLAPGTGVPRFSILGSLLADSLSIGLQQAVPVIGTGRSHRRPHIHKPGRHTVHRHNRVRQPYNRHLSADMAHHAGQPKQYRQRNAKSCGTDGSKHHIPRKELIRQFINKTNNDHKSTTKRNNRGVCRHR